MARTTPLQCPFCNTYLRAPMDINFKDMEFTGGICTCKSVYLLDRSGRNLGETYLDAITFLCRGDYEKALNLDPSEYETVDLDYNYQSNTIGAKKAGEKHCKIIFARLKGTDPKGQ
jgi:hypothetical protein